MTVDQAQLYEPYPGPRPFVQDEKDRFFGRDKETADLTSLIIANRAVILHAQSGAGKSSLLEAGLIPSLLKKGLEVLPVGRLGAALPTGVQLGEVANVYAFNLLISWAKDETGLKDLVSIDMSQSLGEFPRETDREGLPVPRLIVIDQFEELFTTFPERWGQRKEFMNQLARVLEEDELSRVLLVIREDFLAHLDDLAGILPGRKGTRFHLRRLTAEAAKAAVEKPLQKTTRRFAPDVADQLVSELLKTRTQKPGGGMMDFTGEFVDPVQLQIVCRKLWADLPAGRTVIEVEDLQAHGDVDQALRSFYDEAIRGTANRSHLRQSRLRRWFECEMITSAGTRGMAFRGQHTTAGIPNEAVEDIENRHHIVQAELRGGGRWYELTHDRFIQPIQESNAAFRRKRRWQQGTLASVLLVLFISTGVYLLEDRRMREKQRIVAELHAALEGIRQLEASTRQAAVALQHEISAGDADDTAASKLYSKAIAIYEGIRQALLGENTEEWDVNLARVLNNRAIRYYRLRQYVEALTDYGQAEELFTRLVDDEGRDELVEDLATVLSNRGNTYYAKRMYAEALADYHKAVAIRTRLVEDEGRDDLANDLAWSLAGRGRTYDATHMYVEALADYDKAVAIRTRLVEKEGRDELADDLATLHNNRGSVYDRKGMYPDALVDYDKAVAIRTRLIEEEGHDELADYLAWSLRGRGRVLVNQGNFSGALLDHNKAVETYLRLIEQEDRDELIEELAGSLKDRGDAFAKSKAVDAALRDFDESIQLYDRLMQAGGRTELSDDIADALLKRGALKRRENKGDEAIADLERAIGLATDPVTRELISKELQLARS